MNGWEPVFQQDTVILKSNLEQGKLASLKLKNPLRNNFLKFSSYSTWIIMNQWNMDKVLLSNITFKWHTGFFFGGGGGGYRISVLLFAAWEYSSSFCKYDTANDHEDGKGCFSTCYIFSKPSLFFTPCNISFHFKKFNILYLVPHILQQIQPMNISLHVYP